MKSVYFPQYGGNNSEQRLVQDLVDEQIKLFGQDVYYLPKEILLDKSLNDVVISKFRDCVMIEMMLINVEGFGGPSSLAMSKFGLKISDEVTFAVSKRRWQMYAEDQITTMVPGKPNEGDLIYVPMTKNTYEIKYVEREIPFYQLGKNYIFGLTCELLENANNEFRTGINELDDLSQESYVFPVTFKENGYGDYKVGEIVSQKYLDGGSVVEVNATVVKWNLPTRQLNLTYINGTLKKDIPILGLESNAEWIVESFSTIEFETENYINSQNKIFEEEADKILDFTETNPFGEYGNMEDSF
jgi:hypothetical protein